jgi:predicted amidophosphoribosyltransferase
MDNNKKSLQVYCSWCHRTVRPNEIFSNCSFSNVKIIAMCPNCGAELVIATELLERKDNLEYGHNDETGYIK